MNQWSAGLGDKKADSQGALTLLVMEVWTFEVAAVDTEGNGLTDIRCEAYFTG